MTIYSLNLRDFWSHIEKKNGENLCLKCQRKTCRSSSRSYVVVLVVRAVTWLHETRVKSRFLQSSSMKKMTGNWKSPGKSWKRKSTTLCTRSQWYSISKKVLYNKKTDWLTSMNSAFSNCFMSCNISWMSNSLKAQNFKSSAYKGNGSLEDLDFSI